MAKNQTAGTTDEANAGTMTAADFAKEQAGYTGNSHSDLVRVKIVTDAPQYGYKAGQEDIVHPATALLLKAKGLIEDEGTPYERPKFEQKDVTVDA